MITEPTILCLETGDTTTLHATLARLGKLGYRPRMPSTVTDIEEAIDNRRVGIRVLPPDNEINWADTHYYEREYSNYRFISAASWLREQGPTPTPTPTPKSLNQVACDNLQLKPGDRVKVAFQVPSCSCGWDGSWQPSMTRSVGETGVVDSDVTSGKVFVKHGCPVHVDGGSLWYYPYFCLELVSRAPERPAYPSRFLNHAVSVYKHGIAVGCQEFRFSDYHTLYEYAKTLPSCNLFKVTEASIRGHIVPTYELRKFLRDLEPVVKYFEDQQ